MLDYQFTAEKILGDFDLLGWVSLRRSNIKDIAVEKGEGKQATHIETALIERAISVLLRSRYSFHAEQLQQALTGALDTPSLQKV